MTNLNYSEIEAIQNILRMQNGYVSDFSNNKFANFMYSIAKVRIYDEKYSKYGDSKAKRLKAFFELEPNDIVGKVIKELVEREKRINKQINETDYKYTIKIVNKLLDIKESKKEQNKKEFALETEFKDLNINRLNIELNLKSIIKNRVDEIRICIKSKACLSAIILIGSTLEAILFELANKNPSKFNQTNSTPKNKYDGKPLKFNEWTLSNLIDVSYETKSIGEDAKKFSHSLREFRNYIHPYQQMISCFIPDYDTVKLCWQVLQCVINDLTK